MRQIRLDDSIVRFIKKVKYNLRLGDGSIISIAKNAIRYFLHKPDPCFTCPIHKECIATIELGRQKLAISRVNEGKDTKAGGLWVGLYPIERLALFEYSVCYRRTAKQVAEQAIVEHLTRPPQCLSCSVYFEMKEKVKQEYGEGELSESAPGHKVMVWPPL